jgi:superfamily I DNA and RNA helicase
MIEYTTSDQLATDHGVKACIYGNAGSGKTIICATAPRPLMLQAENGALALKILKGFMGLGRRALVT